MSENFLRAIQTWIRTLRKRVEVLAALHQHSSEGAQYLFYKASAHIRFATQDLHPEVISALQRDLPIKTYNGHATYRPEPFFLRNEPDIILARTNAPVDATRFIFVRRDGVVIGPNIRRNGTELDRPKKALRVAREAVLEKDNFDLDFVFALPFLEVGDNFGHFLISHAPKIRHWSVQGKYGDNAPTILIDGGHTWQFEILKLLGVPDEKVVVVGRDVSKIRIKRLAMVDEKYIGGRSPSFCLEALRWIRDQLLKSVPAPTEVHSRPLYLEREPAARRVVLNTRDVRDLVKQHGGITVRPVDLTVSDQIKLIAGSQIIVGTNGTELVLSIFATPGASIISIVPPGPHFQGIVPALSLASGHCFYPLFTTNFYEGSTPGDLRDMHAPIDKLDELLRSRKQ